MKKSTNNLLHQNSLLSEGHNPQELNKHAGMEIRRKPSNAMLTGNKNNLSETKSDIQDPPNELSKIVFKNAHSNSTASLNNPIMKPMFCLESMKTERRDVNYSQKKHDEDSTDYYKYWKKKANDYQEENFELHKTNSSLLEQNEILKFKIEKLEKRIETLSLAEYPVNQNNQNYQKLDTYLKLKMEKLTNTISEQELLIQKQNKKIQELSNNCSENKKLKSVIDNMEERIIEIKSSYGGSRNNSEVDPYENKLELHKTGKDIRKKCSDHLHVGNYLIDQFGHRNVKHSGSFLNKSRNGWD